MSTIETLEPSFGVLVCEFLGQDDEDFRARADATARFVGQLAFSYTRGRGFVYDDFKGQYLVNEDIVAVIVVATARLMSNPAQVDSESADGWSSSGGFRGWTIPEMKVLNSYRRVTV